jgi:hypothetical protein
MILFWGSGQSYAQKSESDHPNSISIQFIGLAFHPEAGTYPHLYKLRLDPKGFFVVELGAAIQYRYAFSDRWSFNHALALYSDCAQVMAGFVHFGIRYNLIVRGPHTLSVDLGGSLLFREDWHQFEEYTGDTFFQDRVYKGYQYRFYPMGEIEYAFQYNPRWQYFISLVPGGKYVYTSSLGMRHYW